MSTSSNLDRICVAALALAVLIAALAFCAPALGEDWGLYLAVEGVEESFLLRNYGELYKPDSMEMGGGRGNGGGFSGRGGMGGMPSDMGEPPEDMGGGLLSMLPWDYNLASAASWAARTPRHW